MNNIETAYRAFCRERFSLPSEEKISALEVQLGIRLPSNFRRFLLEYNGGIFTEPHIIPPDKDCPLDRLTFMNGIGAQLDAMEFASDADLALFDDNDSPQILPIGYTIMGNLLNLLVYRL
jgi:hypothetical protein